MANTFFKYNPEYLNLPENIVKSSTGDIYSEQLGISQDQIDALELLAREVTQSHFGPYEVDDERMKERLIGGLATKLPAEDANYFVPGANVSNVPSYLRGPMSGDLPSGDPLDTWGAPGVFYDVQDRPQHPGTFEEYSNLGSSAGFGQLSKKDLIFNELKNDFILHEFPESQGDVRRITDSIKIQEDILSRADEYAKSNVDDFFKFRMEDEYMEEITPIMKSLEYISSPSDYERTLNTLSKMKPVEEPVVESEKVYSNKSWAKLSGLSVDKIEKVYELLTPKQKEAFNNYINSTNK